MAVDGKWPGSAPTDPGCARILADRPALATTGIQADETKRFMKEVRGSLGTVECATCGSTRFDVPRSEKEDPLFKCRCGATVGPISSLRSFANNEAHTHVNAKIKNLTWI